MTIPDYSLRYSKKAKYLQLRLSRSGLEVIVPSKTPLPKNLIEQFILEKKSWIERNWSRCLNRQEAQKTFQLPITIHLQAINQSWEVIYLATKHARIRLIANPSKQIKLIGATTNGNLCLERLRQWLKKIAAEHLPERLGQLSVETGLSYNQVSIRNNVTRWGSCSSQRHINLCCKLLFLPPVLVDHVLLHELSHTKVMHHGKSFWKLLEQFDPAARIHSKQLKIAALQVPLWVGYRFENGCQ